MWGHGGSRACRPGRGVRSSLSTATDTAGPDRDTPRPFAQIEPVVASSSISRTACSRGGTLLSSHHHKGFNPQPPLGDAPPPSATFFWFGAPAADRNIIDSVTDVLTHDSHSRPWATSTSWSDSERRHLSRWHLLATNVQTFPMPVLLTEILAVKAI